MSKPIRVVYLELRTWKGVVGWAEHYYADLVRRRSFDDWKRDTKKVWHKLTQSEADRYNRRDSNKDHPYEAGEEVGSFIDEQRAIEESIAQYKDLFPGADTLVKGNIGTYEPQFILDCSDEDDKKRLNELAQAAEDIDWWEEDEEAMQVICDKWREIWIPKYLKEE
jgi:hypothetical protein